MVRDLFLSLKIGIPRCVIYVYCNVRCVLHKQAREREVLEVTWCTKMCYVISRHEKGIIVV